VRIEASSIGMAGLVINCGRRVAIYVREEVVVVRREGGRLT